SLTNDIRYTQGRPEQERIRRRSAKGGVQPTLACQNGAMAENDTFGFAQRSGSEEDESRLLGPESFGRQGTWLTMRRREQGRRFDHRSQGRAILTDESWLALRVSHHNRALEPIHDRGGASRRIFRIERHAYGSASQQ